MKTKKVKALIEDLGYRIPLNGEPAELLLFGEDGEPRLTVKVPQEFAIWALDLHMAAAGR